MHKQKKNQFKSIRVKLFSRVALIFLCAILLFLGLTRFCLPSLYVQSTKRTMLQVARQIAQIEPSEADFARRISTLEKENGVSVDLYKKDGTQLYFGKTEFSAARGKVSISDRQELSDRAFFEKRAFEQENAVFLVYQEILPNSGTLEMYCKTSVIDQSTKFVILLMTCTAAVALLLALIFVYLYSKRFTKPLIEMRDVTKGIADMDFSKACSVGARDEIGELAGSINRLSDSLEGTLEDLSQKNEQLQQDIEKEHALDRMRKDFIAAVSHELKTPISIVGGYAEGARHLLQNGQAEKAVQYCSVIEAEAERMNTLVLELLELSKYESGTMQLQRERFSLQALVQDFLNAYTLKFAEQGIRVTTEFPREPALCCADSSKIRMVLNNYIQNACAHAQGEKQIRVCIQVQNTNFLRLSVFNTGKPIAEEDLPKIWTSFYRADKAHSRKAGRFGLGLSIVEQIEKLHGAACGVQNQKDGVLFWADIPKATDE